MKNFSNKEKFVDFETLALYDQLIAEKEIAQQNEINLLNSRRVELKSNGQYGMVQINSRDESYEEENELPAPSQEDIQNEAVSYNEATKLNAIALGKGSKATAEFAVAIGEEVQAKGATSFATGKKTVAEGTYSSAEGFQTKVVPLNAALEQYDGFAAHAEGISTQANGRGSHAEGESTKALNMCAHAEGWDTHAQGVASHAGGMGTKTGTTHAQTVIGRFNVQQEDDLFIIGNGTSDKDRSNAFVVTDQGRILGTDIHLTEAGEGGVGARVKALENRLSTPLLFAGKITEWPPSESYEVMGYVVLYNEYEYVYVGEGHGENGWEILGDPSNLSQRVTSLEEALENISSTADQIVLKEDLLITTDIGYLESGDVINKGTSLEKIFNDMLSKEVQPTITAQPSISSFKLYSNGTEFFGAKEVGTSYSNIVAKVSFEDGAYSFENRTGVKPISYKIDYSNATGTGSDVIITTNDSFSIEQDFTQSLIYKEDNQTVNILATVGYNNGNIAKTNKGNDSSPIVQISAGETKESKFSFTSYREGCFYGYIEEPVSVEEIKTLLTPWKIRSLNKTGRKYATGEKKTFNVIPGATAVIIACPKGNQIELFNVSANAPIHFVSPLGGSFDLFIGGADSTINSTGSYSKEYTVWYFIPNEAYAREATFEITLK